jgi:hypothetical protein
MTIELLYFDSCPAWKQTLENLNTVLVDRDESRVKLIRIRSLEHAEEEDFIGSPTIRVDGRDIFPSPDQVTGLACRIYFTPDGLSGTPTVEMIRKALGGGN